MCRWKTWKRWNPSRKSPCSKRIRIAGQLIALVLSLFFAFLFPIPPIYADGPTLSTECSYTFSESLDFAMEAKVDVPIVEVILYYGQDGERLVRRIYPDFAPGRDLFVTYTEELESGQFAPGTRIRSWWRLRTAEGSILETPPKVFEYTDDNHDWQHLVGERADLFWYGADESAALGLSAKADSVISMLEKDVGVVIDDRARVYAYNSQQNMNRALSRRSEGYDDRVMTLGVAVSKDTLLLLSTHRDAEMILAHELSHIVVGMATENPYTDLPRWLDEGLAMYAEGEFPSDNRRALEKAVRDDNLLSIRSMSSYSGQASRVDLFYGQVYSVIDFMLQEYGRESMQRLLAEFAKGARQEKALQETYGFDLDELDTRWRASLGLGPRPQVTEVAPASESGKSRTEGGFTCTSTVGALLLPLLGVGLGIGKSARGRRSGSGR